MKKVPGPRPKTFSAAWSRGWAPGLRGSRATPRCRPSLFPSAVVFAFSESGLSTQQGTALALRPRNCASISWTFPALEGMSYITQLVAAARPQPYRPQLDDHRAVCRGQHSYKCEGKLRKHDFYYCYFLCFMTSSYAAGCFRTYYAPIHLLSDANSAAPCLLHCHRGRVSLTEHYHLPTPFFS